MNSEKETPTSVERPDIIEYVVPYIAACRRAFENDTLAEVHFARQMSELVCAVTSELDCDTKTDEGIDAKRMIASAMSTVMQSLDTIESDVSRPRAVRRAELVARLSKYQRELLDLDGEESLDK